MNNYCIYAHINRLSGKVYIGLTNDIKRRWRSKGIEYKPPKSENQNGRRFWNAINRYGWENFEHKVLLENLTFEEAIQKEIEFISQYKSSDKKYGYNISAGGNGGKVYKEHPKGMGGKKHTEEFKIRQSSLMKRLNEEGKTGAVWKHGHPKGMLGKTHSEEYKERLRNTPTHKHPSAKKVIATFANGETKIFDCAKYCREYFDIGSGLMTRLLKSNKPYQLSKTCNKSIKQKLENIEGVKFSYLDNTEVTTGTKKSVAP